MSIYATLWWLKFPRYGDDYIGCEWIRVTAQGVPAHIGTPTRGLGYEDGDPYGEFLPPALEVNAEGDSEFMRAVVFVTEETKKGTTRVKSSPDKVKEDSDDGRIKSAGPSRPAVGGRRGHMVWA